MRDGCFVHGKCHLKYVIAVADVSEIHTSDEQAATAEVGVAQEFHVSNEIATLAVTLFVVGLGTGPMLVGPLAAILGQRIIYIASFLLLFAFTWPVAFSHSLGEPAFRNCARRFAK